jgi:hypothetical protein
MMRFGANPVIFLVNNRGYAIEILIHDGPYNRIQNWDYTGEGKAHKLLLLLRVEPGSAAAAAIVSTLYSAHSTPCGTINEKLLASSQCRAVGKQVITSAAAAAAAFCCAVCSPGEGHAP